MLGNGYRERLACAQNSIGSLFLNLSKTAASSPQQQQQPQEQQLQQSDNEPGFDESSFVKHSAFGLPFHPPASSSPLPPAPAPESNTASRHTSQKQLPPPQQQQQRSSRISKASSEHSRFSFDKVLDAEEFIPSLHENSSLLGVLGPSSQSFHIARTPSRCDRAQIQSHDHDPFDGNTTPMSNSPRLDDLFPPLNSHRVGDNMAVKSSNIVSHPVLAFNEVKDGILENKKRGAAIRVIQRAIRRFLLRKHARAVQNHVDSAVKTKIELKVLQQTCSRQLIEINQLKEQLAKLRLEAEEDQRKLRQKDKEIEELLKLQRLSTSINTSSTTHDLTSSKATTSSKFSDMMGTMASSSTMSTFNTSLPSSFGLSSLTPSSTVASGDEMTSAMNFMDDTRSASAASSIGGTDDAVYDSSFGYGSNHLSSNNGIHPLTAATSSSRSNSIQSLHPPQARASTLKLNVQPFYPQYQGFMDIGGLVESPSATDFGATHGDNLMSASSSGSTPSLTSASTLSRGMVTAQLGYGSQTTFQSLNHRQSGSFTSTSRAFDSPALEQQGTYPWNMSSTNFSHSQSWADDMNFGYDIPVQQSGQYQNNGVSSGFDSTYMNPQTQQHSHQPQPLVQQQSQPQQQQHQPLSSYRSHRRHSEKPAHLDYQMCVDRILQATDQQASIHLQQKLKTSSTDQKAAIIDAILVHAYALMSNRFGNFLIQRCFEFGTPQQIDALAGAMRGNILALACDPFGCHVVQKALDNVDEGCKARIVTEMFRRIPETIVHRYACHVWQKVFEIRWTEAPPAVMTYVNNAVGGKWASVAVDETGSLVVQNIFENCAEHDK
ncbi:hypothetical protein BGZ94_010408, partial [Podila epigama]